MASTQIRYGRIVVDFFHDVAAGVFPGAVIAAWLIRRAAEVAGPGVGVGPVLRASGALWGVAFLGLTVSVVTGLIRLRYWKLNVRTGYLETKAAMASIKHSLFVMMVLLSAVGLYLVTRA